MTRTLVWFRDDLRTLDHQALTRAWGGAEGSGEVLGLYVLDEASPGIRPLGGAARWWLHYALESLREELEALGVPLLIRRGDPARILPQLVADCSVERVHWSRRYGAGERQADTAIKTDLRDRGLGVESFPGFLLHEPWTVQTSTGGPYQVFTPFWNALKSRELGSLEPTPKPLKPAKSPQAQLTGAGVPLGSPSDLDLLPRRPDWASGLRATWDASEQGGLRRLETFLDEEITGYDDARDRPARHGTSRLSPYLRFGQLSPRQIWQAAHQAGPELAGQFLSELGWREFCWHLLYHFPQLPHQNLRRQFDHYPWASAKDEPEAFGAWTRGETGFPWVDAGQRELWETGHMHNRVRMASASLLIKNLGIDWRAGEAWFWDTLVDADPASNPANWQWVAGSGADAAPYFRIFNPERQRRRFDPDDAYISRWVPELGTPDYPEPIVDLQESRREALAHYAEIRGR